ITKGRWLWTRTISSTAIGQGFDSLIFITLAFSGTVPLAVVVQAILSQWIAKSLYEVAATPLTYIIVNALKRAEGCDTFDYQTNFNPLAVSDI
ncbi:MAG: VUT family protein, partial [Chloroflexi bacterium]|nr:VUT family protein [Chloroflexota bacterium]